MPAHYGMADERGFPSISESLQEYGRGLAGGLLFSLPLLYTMEVWWSGFIAGPMRLLVLLAATFLLLLAYNRFAGMRIDTSWAEVAIDSVEELGLGLVTAAGVLYLLGRIGPGIPLPESLGKVVVETAMVAIGFSVGTAQLGMASDEDEGKAGEEPSELWQFVGEIAVALCGAVLFAANVAPTEEIIMIGVEAHPARLLGLALLSLALGTLVLHFVEFKGSGGAGARGKLDILIGTVVSYAVALVASAALLWFFGRFEGVSIEIAARQIVVLALPASLGASAGRLLLQP